ncbi:MAG: hypothetical protein B7X55_14480 [Rhodobacterales bacterium 34-62-10]|nr:MAG: hypothetical protein B7X55_14480 [Rhodobacterales bacterium 34-62-10]
MSDIIGLAASAAGGGVFGLIGTVIGRVAGLIERRQDNTQERARWVHDAAMQEARMREMAAATEAQIKLADAAGAWRGLAASMEAEASIGESYKWVNAVRALTRPLLTLLLWVITGLVYLGASAEVRVGIVETATFAATAATLWWFGDRGQKGR